jgi:predicted enzyme related to lactoylglutathione lyase
MPTQTATIRGIDITAYLAQDADRAVKFYTDLFGRDVTQSYGENGGEWTFPDGTTFGVWKMNDGSFHPSGGVMFAVDDLNEAYKELKSRGVQIEEPFENPPCFMAECKDTEGNSFLLHQRKGGRD